MQLMCMLVSSSILNQASHLFHSTLEIKVVVDTALLLLVRCGILLLVSIGRTSSADARRVLVGRMVQ